MNGDFSIQQPKNRATVVFFLRIGLVIGLVSVLVLSNLGSKQPNTVQAMSWPASTPEAQGIDSNDLIGMLDWIEAEQLDVHSILVMRHNQLVMEVYYPPFDRDVRHLQFSATKSFTSALVGIAVGEGKIQTIDQPFMNYFTDIPVQNMSEWKQSITIRNLLDMTSGLEIDENGHATVEEAVNKPSLKEPGTLFEYNPVNTILLAAIVEKATGMRMADYGRVKLFEPLGIKDVYWASDSNGVTLGAVGLLLTPREMLKFGMLYNQGGVWDGKQVVPVDWVAATMQMNDRGYGYLWWQGLGGIGAAGYSGQRIFVFPQQDIITVVTGEFPEDWYSDNVAVTPLFAIRSDEALPESPASAVLAERIRAIERPQSQPVPASPVMAKLVSGKTIQLDENALGWETANLEFKDKYAYLDITTNADNHVKKFVIGLDGVYRGTMQKAVTEYAVPVPPQRYVLNPYEFNFILGIPVDGTAWMKGAWVDEASFSLIVQDSRDFEKDTLTFHFAPPNVSIDWYSAREMKTQMTFAGQIK